MTEFELDIEETKELGIEGILIYKNAKNERLYFKKGKTENYPEIGDCTELIPLSKDELKAIGIEETAMKPLADIDIEETVTVNGKEYADQQAADYWQNNPTAKQKVAEIEAELKAKKQTFDANKIEDMRLAAKLANDRLNALQGSDTSEVEQLKAERDDYRAKLELIAQKEFEKKKAELNAPSDIVDPESLIAYEKGLNANHYGSNLGGMPLNSAQTGQQQKQGVYSNHGQLIDDLLTKEKYSQDKTERANVKAVLNQMTLKVVKGAKEGKLEGFNFPKEDSVIDRINDSYRKKVLAKRGNSE